MKKYSLFSILLVPLALSSHPQGMQVIQGEAALSQSAKELQITVSDRAILHWDAFSIQAQETAQFIQPSSQSVVINKVVGASSSHLLGDLHANGKVFLLNPNGVLIGEDARIDAGAFTASTFDLLEKENEIHFVGDSESSLVNLGRIQALEGDVVLVARKIENSGQIDALQGGVFLGSGQEAVLKLSGSPRLFVRPHPGSFISNRGTIQALQVEVRAASSSGALAFHHSGSIDALGMEWRDGAVFLVAETGNGLVDGAVRGGKVEIEAEEVRLGQKGCIDASHKYGGGSVSIQGTKLVDIPADARIHCDALEEGDGGSLLIWAKETAQFSGLASARGGPLGGDGGAAEISGKERLGYTGFCDLTAIRGETGTLTLDPIDITIVAGVAGAFAVAPCAGCGTALAACDTFNVTMIGATTITTQLAGSHVIIDAVAGAGGNGDITVSANIAYSSTNNLIFNAARNITVNANIQNSNSGGICLQSSGNGIVTISGASQAVSVGSQNGPTRICAANGTVLVQAGTTASSLIAQVGFFTAVDGTNCTGLIDINCHDLNVLAGGTNPGSTVCGVQIGHGDVATSGGRSMTTMQSNISINVSDAFHLSSGFAPLSTARVGHGAFRLNGAGMNSQDGNISLIVGGAILLDTNANGDQSSAFIGHGSSLPSTTLTDFIDVLQGNIYVRAGGTITMNNNILSATDNRVGVCHLNHQNLDSAVINSAIGDIDVISGGSLVTNGQGTSNHIFIGHSAVRRLGQITGNYRVVVTGDLTMTHSANSQASIGWSRFAIVVANQPLVNGSVSVVVGGNLMMTAGAAVGSRQLEIGFSTQRLTSPRANTYVAVGGDITIQGSDDYSIGIGGWGDINVACRGNITLNANTMAPRAYIGTDRWVDAAFPCTTRIYADGDIIATNTALGQAFLGEGLPPPQLPPRTISLDMRASGDIQMATPFDTGNPGSIHINADAAFTLGQLWSIAGPGQIVSICQQPIAIANTIAFSVCQQAPQNIVSTALLTGAIANNSTQAFVDGRGAFRAVTAPFLATNVVLLQTTAGNITLWSADTRSDGATPQDLNIGPTGPGVNIVTTSGDICISGTNSSCTANGPICSLPIYPSCSDSFRNIFVQQALTTQGDIYISANSNLTVQPTFSVTTTAAPSQITLIADNNLNGASDLILQGNVTTVNGPIILAAGMYGGPGGSSILQTAGIVSSGAGNIDAVASFNISLASSPLSMTTTTGYIHTLTGNNTFLSNTQVLKTGAGDQILMISGNSMNMANSNITSLLTPLTLVVDLLFPSPPGIGTGAFAMDAASTLTSSASNPVQIFTAHQNLNSIIGLINGAVFMGGQLFVNTDREIWCTYPDCPPSLLALFPFTVFYKTCLQTITVVANRVVSEMLFRLTEEWIDLLYADPWLFRVLYDSSGYRLSSDEYYWIVRRRLHFINLPRFMNPRDQQAAND